MLTRDPQPRPDGLPRDVEHRGGLVHRVAGVQVKHDHRPVCGAESGECIAHGRAFREPAGGVIDHLGDRLRDLRDGGWADEPGQPRQSRASLPGGLPNHDAVEPRTQVRIRPERLPGTPRSLERRLDDVLGRCDITAHQPGEADEPVVVGDEERLEGVRVSGRAADRVASQACHVGPSCRGIAHDSTYPARRPNGSLFEFAAIEALTARPASTYREHPRGHPNSRQRGSPRTRPAGRG